jgi:hypothetical protein
MATLPVGLASAKLRVTMRMGADGALEGESLTEASGPYALALRGAGARALARGGVQDAAERLRASQQAAGTGEVVPDPLEPISESYRVAASFRLEPQPDILEGYPFLVPSGPLFLARPGEGLLGPLARGVAAEVAAPCYAGRQEEELVLNLPQGVRPARLPRDRTVSHPLITYSSRWMLKDGVLRVHRALETRFVEQVCEGETRAAAARALEEIRRDHETRMELERR